MKHLAIALALVGGAGCAPMRVAQKSPSASRVPEPRSHSAVARQDAAPDSSEQASGTTLLELYAAGTAAFEAGGYDQAKKFFEAALERSPRDVNAQYNLGLVAERQGDLNGAQRAYETAHHWDRAHLPTLLNLGRVYRGQGRLADAVTLYEAAVSLPAYEHNPAILNSLSVSYRLTKSYAKAAAAARKVLARSPDNLDAYKNLQLIYYEQGMYQLAEVIGTRALKISDKDAGVYNNLGLAHLKMDNTARAVTEFKRAIEVDKQFVTGYINLGAVALTHRDYRAAATEFAHAMGLDPKSYSAALSYAYALDGQKARDPKKGLEAGAAFEHVLALRAEDLIAVCSAGWAYSVDKAGWEKSLHYLERCRTRQTGVEEKKVQSKIAALTAMRSANRAQVSGTGGAGPVGEAAGPKN